jgi:GNAT superfamily N-acetyltransferase
LIDDVVAMRPAAPEEISTDPARLDRGLIHRFLSEESYWSRGIPRDVLDRAIDNSLVFGVYAGEEQIAFARVVTDRATFGWLCDVFVIERERGRGLGVRLMEAVLAHPDLQGLRWFLLGTKDAHDLYRRFGFDALRDPGRFMGINRHATDLYAPR